MRLPIFIHLTDFMTETSEFDHNKWELVPEREIAINIYDIKEIYTDTDEGVPVTVINRTSDDDDLIFSNLSITAILTLIAEARKQGNP